MHLERLLIATLALSFFGCEETETATPEEAPTLGEFHIAPQELDNLSDGDTPWYPSVCSVTPRVGTLAVVAFGAPGQLRRLGNEYPIPTDAICHPENYDWKWGVGSFGELDATVLSSAAGPDLPQRITLRIKYDGGEDIKPGSFFLLTIVEMDGEYYAQDRGMELFPSEAGYDASSANMPANWTFPSTLTELRTQATEVRTADPDDCPYNGSRPHTTMDYYRDQWFNMDELNKICVVKLSQDTASTDAGQ